MVCIVSDFPIYFTENFEKRSHLTPNMASILAATSAARRKGLKFSSVATKQVRDQVEKIDKEVAGHEGDGLPLVNNKGKSKVEKQRFSATREGKSMATSPPPRREASTGKKLMATDIAMAKVLPRGRGHQVGPFI